MKKYRFGCSGWDYEEWVGPLYRSESERKLQAYTRIFNTAEINSTFYRPPSQGMVFGWARYSPEDFVFAAKVPQTVTHDRLLNVEKGAGTELANYCELMRPLLDAGKLGPLLLQLPPRLRFDEKHIGAFLEVLPKDFQFSLEPRNKSWIVPEAPDLLRRYQVAYTVVDEPLLPADVHITAGFGYFRWHGHGQEPWYDYRYTKEELQAWVPKVQEAAGKSEVTYGFFNNHFHGYAPENCLQILEMLGVEAGPEQAKAMKRIEEYRRGFAGDVGHPAKGVTLEDFSEAPIADPELDPLLSLIPRQGQAREGETHLLEGSAGRRGDRHRGGEGQGIQDKHRPQGKEDRTRLRGLDEESREKGVLQARREALLCAPESRGPVHPHGHQEEPG